MALRKLLVPMTGVGHESPALSTALAIAKTAAANVDALFMALVDFPHNRVWRGLSVTLSLVALAMAAWLAAPDLRIGSQAAAAEVDAIGAPAPIGFADIVERVKPAVVGVRVKIEEATPSDDEQQNKPAPPGSPFDRFFRQFGADLWLGGRR